MQNSPVLKSSRQKLNDFKFHLFIGDYKENPSMPLLGKFNLTKSLSYLMWVKY